MVETQTPATLIYLHIPKCAGTSMMDLLQRNYGDGFYRTGNGGGWRQFHKLPLERRAAITCLTGHMPWGLHKYLPGEHRYAVLLRNPVERMASLYWFCRGFKKHHWHKLASRSTLVQFATSRAFADLDNGMTRWLAGRRDVGRLSAKQRVTDEDLRFAMTHVRASWVGFVQWFGSCVYNMSIEFGWKHTAFTHKMAGQYIGPTAQERRAIEDANRMDMALYEYALKVAR